MPVLSADHSTATTTAPQDETHAAIAIAAIAALRGRLGRPGTLDHPAVRHELRKLDEQLAAMPEPAGRQPGRHRAQPGTAPRAHHHGPDREPGGGAP